MDEEAVSPVVGTILLIAITFVLAAAAFFLVGADDEPPEVPRIAFRADHSGPGGTLTVISVTGDSGEAHWARVSLGEGTTASCTLPAGPIHASDVVTCTTEGRLLLVYDLGAGDDVLLHDGEIR